MPLLFIIILTGCSNKEYDSAMDNGKDAIEKEEDKEAQAFFKQALKEKPDDELANIHLEQTQNTILATNFFKEKDFEEAIQALNEVGEHENGSSTLQARANKQLIEIKDIKTTYDQLKKAKKIGDNKEYNKALSVIENSLDKDFNHDSLNSLKKDLTKLQTKLKTAQKNIEKQSEKQELINQVIGYWSYTENDNELCQITGNYYVCAVMESVFYYYGRITSWDVDLNNEVIIMNRKNDSPVTVSISKSKKLTFGVDECNHLSTKEINRLSNFYDGTSEEFFDINKLEERDSQNEMHNNYF